VTEKPLPAAERRDRLRLSLSENVGPATYRSLIAKFGSAAEAIAALPELSRRGGLSRPLRLCSIEEAQRDLDLAEAMGARLVFLGETSYPALLGHIEGAPPALWLRGNLARTATTIAIVGSRNASAAGLKFTRRIASALGEANCIIVSGLARGIDSTAHEASLATGTIAVLAGGLDVIYPPENERLHAMIAEQGLLVSEMRAGSVPRAEHFPRRNRIISGLSRAVVVVEAALRSGSLITARYAGEQGRDVLAVPGSPLDPRCEGTNRLIRQGATLITSADDVLEALGAPGADPAIFLREPDEAPGGSPAMTIAERDRERILSLLSPTPIGVDDLIRESGLSAAIVTGILLELDLAGRIVRQPGNQVARF